jgi:hypothetical protein
MGGPGRGRGVPSSLIFAALAGAWLVVLVPMVATRRQEVVRTAESALASRVLRRPSSPCAAPRHSQETRMIEERTVQQAPAPDERRRRSGRGGYDPELAAQLARAKYAYRQRVVLGVVIGAITTLVLAYAVSSLLWWIHAALDMALVGYLGYLRRQVRIEEDVRQRRAARLAASRVAGSRAADVPPESPVDVTHEAVQEPPVGHPAPPHPTAVALDFDDEDPMFDELQPTFEPRYRRAVGE